MSETILMAVNQELLDAITEALRDSSAYRIERGEKPDGAVVQEFVDRAERQLQTVEVNRNFFVEKKVNYEENGDVLWA